MDKLFDIYQPDGIHCELCNSLIKYSQASPYDYIITCEKHKEYRNQFNKEIALKTFNEAGKNG